MASYGLLGAIGGLGQALQTVGAGIEQRRQQALEAARRDAEYQRQRADRREDRAEDFENRRELAAFSEERRDIRQTQQQKATHIRTEEDREFRRQERLEGQEWRTGERRERQNHEQQLTRLRAALSRANDAASIRLREELGQDNVAGVQYGPANEQGLSEAIIVRRDGTLVPTGRYVQRYNNRTDDGRDSLD